MLQYKLLRGNRVAACDCGFAWSVCDVMQPFSLVLTKVSLKVGPGTEFSLLARPARSDDVARNLSCQPCFFMNESLPSLSMCDQHTTVDSNLVVDDMAVVGKTCRRQTQEHSNITTSMVAWSLHRHKQTSYELAVLLFSDKNSVLVA